MDKAIAAARVQWTKGVSAAIEALRVAWTWRASSTIRLRFQSGARVSLAKPRRKGSKRIVAFNL